MNSKLRQEISSGIAGCDGETFGTRSCQIADFCSVLSLSFPGFTALLVQKS